MLGDDLVIHLLPLLGIGGLNFLLDEARPMLVPAELYHRAENILY
jgi:hypothetical protein